MQQQPPTRTGSDMRESFEVHQQRFDKIIAKLPASAELLTRIKLEYELVLKKVSKSRVSIAARTLQENVRATEVATLSNYHRRVKELEVKLEKIQADNIRMQREIDEMRAQRSSLAANYDEKIQATKVEINRPGYTRRSLGLPLLDETSINYLQKHLAKMEAKLEETIEVSEKKYVSGQRKSQLQDQLKAKEVARTTLAAENKSLTVMLNKLSLATKAVESYQPYLRSKRTNQAKVPIDSYIRAAVTGSELNEDVTDEDDEDPMKDVEAEMILDCYEKFNDLFESERYEEAALHAATSPKGILRTIKTLLLFKTSARHQTGKKLPLLSYCEYLLQCAPAYRPITLQESIEAAKCILKQGELDKLIHWVAQGSMPSSVELGNLIYKNCHCTKLCKCGCKSLAFTVFDHCRAQKQAASCLIEQGKFMHFLSYAAKARLAKSEYVDLLCATPSTNFALMLVSPPHPHQPILSVFELMKILLEIGHGKNGVKYLLAYLKKIGLSLIQVIMKDDQQSEQELLEELTANLYKFGFEDMALELVSSLTVKSALQRTLLQLKDEVIPNRLQSSSGSEEYSSGSSESGESGSYENTTDDENEDTD